MKQLLILLPLTIILNYDVKAQNFYEKIFTDSAILAALEPLGVKDLRKLYVLNQTDTWHFRRFYFRPPGRGQHNEGMNLYAYGDDGISKLITPSQWSFLAHKALIQSSKKIKNPLPNTEFFKDSSLFLGEILFSITQPVTYENITLIDLTYYLRNEEPSLKQWYIGQSLFIFEKKAKRDWRLVKIVNRSIQ